MVRTLIGKFRVCEDGGAKELASKVSDGKVPIFEINKEPDRDEYLVSSLAAEDVSKILFPGIDIPVGADSVELALSASAVEISKKRDEIGHIFIYKGGTMLPIYETGIRKKE